MQTERSSNPLDPHSRRRFMTHAACGAGLAVGAGLFGLRFLNLKEREGASKAQANGPADDAPLIDAEVDTGFTLEKIQRDHFAEQLNSRFCIENAAADEVEIELTDVSDAEIVHAGDRRCERFALTFRGSKSTMLEQNTYTIRHEKLGTFALFVAPVGRMVEAIEYEAVFNRYV